MARNVTALGGCFPLIAIAVVIEILSFDALLVHLSIERSCLIFHCAQAVQYVRVQTRSVVLMNSLCVKCVIVIRAAGCSFLLSES